MKEQLRVYLDNLFQDAPHTARAAERKGQLFQTLSDKYDEMVAEGTDPQTAINICVRSVSNVPAIFDGLDKDDYGVHSVKHEPEVQILAPDIPVKKKRKSYFMLTWPILVCFILTGLIGLKETNGVHFHGPNRPPFFVQTEELASSTSLVNTTTYPASKINDIDIGVGFDSITFYTTDGDSDNIEIKEYSNLVDAKNNLAKISLGGDELTIDKTDDMLSFFNFDFGDRQSYIEIYAPASFYEKANKDFNISTISGEVIFQGDIILNADKLELQTTSGIIELSNVTTDDLNMSSTSGSVYATNIKADKIHSHTTSGDIQLHEVTGKIEAVTISGDIEIFGGNDDISLGTTSGFINISNADGLVEANTTSGEIQINDSIGGAKVNSVSGNVFYDCRSLTKDTEISTISGAVNMSIPETADYKFEANTVSGYISTFYGEGNKKLTKEMGNGSVDINVDTVSGGINVSPSGSDTPEDFEMDD